MNNFGNDIVLTSGGGTVNITPTYPALTAFRVTGTVTLSSSVTIQLNPAYTPSKWDTYYFFWDAAITLATKSVTIFGKVLTADQCLRKGFFIVQYDGSAWLVRVFVSDGDKPNAVGAAERTTLTNGGGTITLDPRVNYPVLSLVGSPTLSSSWTVQGGGSPLAGDTFIVYYAATAAVGANTITIFSKQLTAAQALAGTSIVFATYDGTAWQSILLDPVGEEIWERGSGTLSAQTIGTGCDASGDYSVAIGQDCVASGGSSFAEGNTSLASGGGSHAEGNSVSTANYSHSEGSSTLASGDYSHAEGSLATASGIASHAEGNSSVAHLHSSSAFSSGQFSTKGDAQRLEVQLKKITTDATPAYMLLGDGATEIEIPTDCTMNILLRITAVQNGGTSGDVGDSFMQNIKLCVKNVAGTSSVVPMNAVTLANYSVVADDVLYELSACDAAFGGTVTVSVAANTLHVEVTGEADKSIKWLCHVDMVMIGHTNYSI